MFVLCSAVRNVYTAVGNVHTAVGNVHSALRNIKQKPVLMKFEQAVYYHSISH